jgi:hypothetical protein
MIVIRYSLALSYHIQQHLLREQVLRLTGLFSTIQIEEKLFDDLRLRLGFSSTRKQQLSKIKLVELNQEYKYVRLMLI